MDATNKTSLSSSEVAFPRGGGSVLTPLEVKTISNQATEDVLFEQASSAKRPNSDGAQPQKKRKKPAKKTAGALKPAEEEQLKPIEHFNFKNLLPGCSVLGQIVAIHKVSLLLALGDNLVGEVPITAISAEVTQQLEKYESAMDSSDEEDEEEATTFKPEFPKLASLFSVGQWLRAVVTPGDEKKKQITLSIEPETVNAAMENDDLTPGNIVQASVKSLEDHGVIFSVGISNLSGFMSKKELKKADLDALTFKVGGVVLASVASSNGRIVTLRPAENENFNKKTTVTTISSIDAVHPGAAVNAIITEVSEDGVAARVFGMVDATFALPHAGEYSIEKLKNHFAVGSTVRARIIGTLLQEGAKKFVLSRASRVIALKPELNKEPLTAFPIGFVFDEPVEVVGADKLYIYVTTGASDIRGQVHKSNVDPEKVANIEYPIGSKHRARVLGFNEVDNVLLMTLNPKAINSKFVSPDDISVGEYIPSAEIVKFLPDNKGMLLKIFGEFTALVHPSQMSDIKLVYPERKFKVGAKVKGRVLSKSGRKLYVTLRKSLVNLENDAIVSSFDNLTVGSKTSGVVERFVPGGALVSFFGNVKAFLPKNEISETFVQEAKDYLKLGQPVNVRVLSVQPKENKATVTLRQAAELSEKQVEHLDTIEIGRTVVNASIVEKTKDDVLVELEGSDLRGVVSSGQLSDGNFEENRIILKSLKTGGTLEVVVLEKDIRARAVICSAKKSLINAAKTETLPVEFEDVHMGSVVSGYIKSVTSMGIFVSFAGRLTGLVLPKFASEDPTADLLTKFSKYQSVTCSVVKTDDENRRFLLSFTDVSSEGAFASFKLKNPVDSALSTVTDFAAGTVTTATVDSIEPGYLKVKLADNLFGRIDACECIASWSQIKNPQQPLASYTVGQELKVKVIGYYSNGKFSAAANFSKETMIAFTALPKSVKSKKPFKPSTLRDLRLGDEHVVFIEQYAYGLANVTVSPGVKGLIQVYDLSNNFADYEDFEQKFPLGTAVRAKVIEFDSEHNKALLSCRDSEVTSIADLKVGEQFPGRVIKVTQSYVLSELGKDVLAYAYITDALNDYEDKLQEVYKQGQAVLTTITELNADDGKISVSLRNEKIAKNKPINSLAELERGAVVKGFVKSINNNGLYVSLGRDLFALVRVADISDAFLSDWKKYFKLFQTVVGKVSQCETEGRILITLKESELNGDLKSFKRFSDLEVGEIYDGSIKKVADFGVFVKLDGTANVSGLCHRSEISDNHVENAAALFGEGDRVKVKILKIDADKHQLSLGMKASYFTDLQDEDSDMKDAEDEESEDENSEDEVMADAFDEDDDELSEEEEKTEKPATEGLSGLSTNGFDWTASILDQAEDDDVSSDEDEDFTQIKKKKKKGKKQIEDKTGEINTRAPQSIGDFERLLVGNPDSSVLWMNYMSFQLQLGEIDKSREIAERALKTINFREEQEKMNIWIAILNLENSFGSDESLNEAFKRAVQYMDSLTMHQKLIGIYQLSEKFDKAEELYKVMTKKFSQNPLVWVQNGSYLMDRKQFDDAHAILARALQSLPKREHIEVVRKFGQLEFSKGDPEQGRSLFEGLITDAPKRIDLWNVYIDQEIKQGDREKVEALFERVFTKKLSRKQAKFFFSKWLSYEEEHGDEQSAARVKALAVEYVQSRAKEEE